jgi:hypothetical protein
LRGTIVTGDVTIAGGLDGAPRRGGTANMLVSVTSGSLTRGRTTEMSSRVTFVRDKSQTDRVRLSQDKRTSGYVLFDFTQLIIGKAFVQKHLDFDILPDHLGQRSRLNQNHSE